MELSEFTEVDFDSRELCMRDASFIENLRNLRNRNYPSYFTILGDIISNKFDRDVAV